MAKLQCTLPELQLLLIKALLKGHFDEMQLLNILFKLFNASKLNSLRMVLWPKRAYKSPPFFLNITIANHINLQQL